MRTKRMSTLMFLVLSTGAMLRSGAAYSQEFDASIREFFDSNIGNWDVTYKNWGMVGIKEPQVFSGNATCSLFGKSWLISELTLENGIKSKWTLGYSSKDNTFFGNSIVNFSPYMEQQNGAYDDTTKTLTLFYKDKEVIFGEETEGKMELTIVDKTERICSTFAKNLKTGNFRKNGEITFKRKAEDNQRKDETQQSVHVELDPLDFAVPAIAFQDFSIDQFAGGIRVESDTFSAWLEKTGTFGEIVALSDRRIFELAVDARLRRNSTAEQLSVHAMDQNDDNSIPENRVCDVAYQLIYRKYDAKPLGYRINYQDRDRLLAGLVSQIERTED